jgi:putative oligomerization/nucleic acid binding protein
MPTVARWQASGMRVLIMGDPVIPERGGGRSTAPQGQAEIPAMPVIAPSEQVPGAPYPILDGLSPTLGWEFRSSAKGGHAFVIARRTALGSLKVVDSFPLTEDGWARAWQSLVRQNPAAIPQILVALAAREAEVARLRARDADAREVAELEAHALLSLRGVAYLGGYVPESPIRQGSLYDVLFLEDRLVVSAHRQATMLTEVHYSQVEDVEIGGPGLVKTGGRFVGGGFGGTGAVEGMAIAAVLNALTTRTSVKTIVRIQGSSCELFLLHTSLTPEQLRIAMSRPLAVIRSARATQANGGTQNEPPVAALSPVQELTKLADMLEKGLLTREEFDLMKARLLGPPTV